MKKRNLVMAAFMAILLAAGGCDQTSVREDISEDSGEMSAEAENGSADLQETEDAEETDTEDEAEALEMSEEEKPKTIKAPDAAISTTEELYAAYSELVGEYEQTYGTAVYDQRSNAMSGTFYIRLLDFDGDGSEELLVVFLDNTDEENISVFDTAVDIWSVVDGKVEQVFGRGIPDVNGGYLNAYYDPPLYLSLVFHDGKYYIESGLEASHDLYGLDNGIFSLAKSFYGDSYFGEPYIVDGQEVTYEEFTAEYEAWYAENESCGVGTMCEQKYVERAQQVTEQTKAVLAMEKGAEPVEWQPDSRED